MSSVPRTHTPSAPGRARRRTTPWSLTAGRARTRSGTTRSPRTRPSRSRGASRSGRTSRSPNEDSVRAAVLHAPYDVRLEQAPDPKLEGPRDAVVRVVASCICGSDLWPYRGDPAVREPRRMGHEFVGIVEEIGDDIGGVRVGDLVIAPFVWSDGTCEYCRRGLQTSCLHGGGDGGRRPARRGRRRRPGGGR